MTGDELKALRVKAGFSQAELAAAIGMSRESISRMERGKDVIEKRTELALRYIATLGLPAERPLEMVYRAVANVLDDASVRATPSMQRSDDLNQALEDWMAAGGSDAGRQLIYRAQGVIGQINVTTPKDAIWNRIMSDLSQVRRDWAVLDQ